MTQLAFDFSTRDATPVSPATAQSDNRRSRGAMAYHGGAAAEAQVASDYERRGFNQHSARWRGRGGEIDLVFRDGDGLIFVEVKRSRSFDCAAARLSRTQMNRIYTSAAEYLDQMPRGSLTEVRFDVALVNGHGETRIIENAFGMD